MTEAVAPAPGSVLPDGVAPAEIGVIGGSGFYAFLDDVTEVRLETPYGEPSDALFFGVVGGRRVAFLPRHGRDHAIPPHRINYRANLWALRAAGASQVLAPCAVGGLRPDLGPGTLVVPDQLVDRTSGRVQTYFHEAPAPVVHTSFADPYCPAGRAVVSSCARSADWAPVDDGTLVVIEGPRFSTRAESRWYSAQGWSIVGMTGHPEAVLARELGLCFTAIALVTDLDAGVESGDGVTHAEVLEVFAKNVGRLRTLLFDVVAAMPVKRSCACGGDEAVRPH
ncbi:S-methyl-5'-thioadenosine phosphorylase [Yinghuangia sp. YIM S10712]|uniref:S-methyl-5'-thioadenosine phosphorylase n=1 Tax=Yinghuangia sp. YIM S10712 TaxID=3436930 RepID=UPI003F52998E